MEASGERIESIVSPSLLASVDIDRPVSADLRIGWEDLLGEPVDPKDYVGLSYPENLALDEVLLAASQQYESSEVATSIKHLDIVRLKSP